MYHNRQGKPPTSSRGSFHNNISYYDYPNYHVNQTYNMQQQPHQSQQQFFRGERQMEPRIQHQMEQRQPRTQTHQDRTSPPLTNYDDYKIYICPGCSLHFDCLSRNNRYVGRVPLILKCHHTVCQECIYKGAQKNEITCPTCKKSSEVTKKHLIDNLQEAFAPNYFLIGVILWAKAHGGMQKQLALVPSQVSLNQKKLQNAEQSSEVVPESGERCCFVKCNKIAVLHCQDCNDIYCSECCTVIHKSAKSLWSHVQTQLINSDFSAELENCREHTMVMEFFCRTCGTSVCCYCFIEKHEGHDKEHLSKLNDEEQVDFENYKEKSEEIFKQLFISHKKLQNVLTNSTLSVENQISSYFVNLHARCYDIEKNLRKELLNFQGENKVSEGLGDINSNLESSINNLKNILKSLENVDKKKINLRKLLQKLKDVQQTPCYLLNENGANTSDPIILGVDPVLEDIEQYFHIKRSVDNMYTLVAKDQLPPDYIKEPIDEQYENSAEAALNTLILSAKTESLDNVSSNNRKVNDVSSMASTSRQTNQNRYHRKKIDMKPVLDNELVEVTHIESLECFYVQLKKAQNRLLQMNKEIDNYIKMGASRVENPEIQELYLAQYTSKNEKIWCRARLLEIKSGRSEIIYEVFFIDYGSNQFVNIEKLREITPKLAQRKPFAIQCELYNPTGAHWSKNAHVYMGKMINGKEVHMMTKNIDNNVHIVDLMVSSSNRGVTSIIDILIHTCTNALSVSSDSSSVSSQKATFYPETKVYTNTTKFEKNQSREVTLANIIDPHNIFVHVADYAESLRKLNNQMRNYYKKTKTELCIPIEGTYVVVEFRDPIRGNWHRAFVKKVDLNSNKAHVLLVDWGNNVVVSWTNIRVLSESFSKLEAQAILVKLAQVVPYEGSSAWSDSATLFLQKNFTTQNVLKMIVHNVDPLEVALFEHSDSFDLCINAQLVKEKLADSTGKISSTLIWPQNEKKQKGFSEEDGFVASLLKKVHESEDVDTDDESDTEHLVKQRIDVVRVVSPDLIYIKFLHLEEQEQTLNKELQIHYSNERGVKENWLKDENCVVMYNNQYVRGKILDRINDRYKINIYDNATEVILPKEKIFIYSNYFKKFPSMVYKSYLARIRPAGGDAWSLSSTEALENTFNKFKEIYATRVQGDISKKSMPMLMWYTQVKICGALEPSVTKFVSINKLLVKLGFAYKLQINAEDEEKEKSETTDLNDEKNLTENEPLATTSESLTNGDSSNLNELGSSGSDILEKEKQDETSEKKMEIDTERPNKDWNKLIDEEEERSISEDPDESPVVPENEPPEEAPIEDWKPAFKLQKTNFNAWITCAETEGFLYLRDEDFQPIYKEVEAKMKKFFDENPPIRKKTNWLPGQICTIAYKNYWYRGKILKVEDSKNIQVLMIDFGSDHILPPDVLYQEILYPEIPAFATKVKLDRIFAISGVWLSSDYENLLDIVTEYARVEVKSSLDIEIPLVEIYTTSGQNVNQLLVDACPNLTRCSNKSDSSIKSDDDSVLIEEEEEEVSNNALISPQTELISSITTTDMKFKMEPLPKEAFKENGRMSIVFVLSYNTVVLKLPKDNEKQLVHLSGSILNSYDTQPVLENLEVGMPCICPYADDGIWYRARIHNVEGLECGYVFVFFVDFGNVESVSIKEIRTMKPEWFDLPVSCYIANVNIELKTDNHLEHIFQYMKKLVDKDKWVQIVSENPLVVSLHESNGVLVYESFISSGLLTVK